LEKTFDFREGFEDLEPKWRKIYKIQELNGAEILEIDNLALERTPEGEMNFDYSKWSLELLKRSLRPKLSEAQLKSMPASLFTFLMDQARRLNSISAEERNFLFRAQHSAMHQKKV